MKISDLVINSNKIIAQDTYEMVLSGDDFSNCNYGQFINIKIGNNTLRRPISISDFSQETLTIVYKVVGCGTKELSIKKPGDILDVMYPLGTGFDLSDIENKDILLISGGVGLPPLYGLYNHLEKKGNKVLVYAGFSSATEVFYQDKIENMIVSLPDNINVLEHIKSDKIKYDYYFTCGPSGLIKALAEHDENGQALLEEKMACGIGACMGCSVKTGPKTYKRVCVEGPMFYGKEINESRS